MCGRYTVLTETEIIEIREILKELSLRIVKDEFLEYGSSGGEVRPTDKAPIIVSEKQDGSVSLENVKWGFKKWNGSGVIINACVETLKSRSTFAGLSDTHRCVIPAGQFFEWEHIGKESIKHFIKDKDGNILFMAGLYRDTPEGREFVIITEEATGELAKIHKRSPKLLKISEIEAWLNPSKK